MEPDDLSDPDLRAAIAASLKDCHDPATKRNNVGDICKQEVVDLTADSDDGADELISIYPKSKSRVASEEDNSGEADLARAIALSNQTLSEEDDSAVEDQVAVRNDQVGIQNPATACSRPSREQTTPVGILGLDRRKMEQERLARLTKRKAEETSSLSPTGREMKIQKIEDDVSSFRTPDSTAGARALLSDNTPSWSRELAAETSRQIQQTAKAPQTVRLQFPSGVVKKTWVMNHSRDGDDIKIEEVFQKADLELAVLSSFMWDTEWLFSKLDIHRTRFVLVMQAKEESTRRQYERETASMRNLSLCFPPMGVQVNCMHSKLMLLFHPTYLRIVVPSANLVPYDWGECGGVMENMAFIIDLPKKSLHHTGSGASKLDFYDSLVYFLNASGLNQKVVAKLENFDFSATGHIALIHTIGGIHAGNTWERTGYSGLARAVNSLGLSSSQPLQIDFVTSSVGSLTDEFLRSLYFAAQGETPSPPARRHLHWNKGDDGMKDNVLGDSKTSTAKKSNHPQTNNTTDEYKHRFRVFFPSESTVKASIGGPRCAGTICFQSKWYQGAKFPRQVLRDCVSRRRGLLMHNKIMFVRPDQPIMTPNQSRCRGWAYVGSANLSESAWGRLTHDRTTKEPKLHCRNWECGVLIPILETSIAQQKEIETDSTAIHRGRGGGGGGSLPSTARLDDWADIFEGAIPVPMRVPGQPYGTGLKPWYFMG